MITWWMKLGGNLPLEHDALLLSISGTGSCMCSVAQTRLDIPRPLPSHGPLGGKSKCSGTKHIIRTADLSVHSRTCHPPDHDNRPCRPSPGGGGGTGGVGATWVNCFRQDYIGSGHMKAHQTVIRPPPPEISSRLQATASSNVISHPCTGIIKCVFPLQSMGILDETHSHWGRPWWVSIYFIHLNTSCATRLQHFGLHLTENRKKS